jgi:hypothetical protein
MDEKDDREVLFHKNTGGLCRISELKDQVFAPGAPNCWRILVKSDRLLEVAEASDSLRQGLDKRQFNSFEEVQAFVEQHT